MQRQDLLRMTYEIVMAWASHVVMDADEAARAITRIYRVLRWVESQEGRSTKREEKPAELAIDSIRRNRVICLECGRSYRQIFRKHLARHGLTPMTYKKKHGIPLGMAPSARVLSAKRRRYAKQRRLGDKLSWLRQGTSEGSFGRS